MGSCCSCEDVVVGSTEAKTITTLPDGSTKTEVVASEKRTMNQWTGNITTESETVLPDGSRVVTTKTEAPTMDDIVKQLVATNLIMKLTR
jgi:hypothetical protein